MPFNKATSSQHAHYDAAACVMNVRSKPFGILVCSEEAVELLEFNTQRWWPLPSLPNPRGCCAVATVGSLVYVVGGQEGTQASSTCQSLEFGATAWQQLPPMAVGRCYPAAIGMGDSLFVVGGRNQWQSLNTLEVLHVDTQQWMPQASFQTPRMAPAVVAVQEFLVLMGGYTGEEWTTSVEIYNTLSNAWDHDHAVNDDSHAAKPHSLQIPPLPVPLAFPKAVAVPSTADPTKISKLLVIGTTLLKSSGHASYTVVLSFNLQTLKWTKLASGAASRSNKKSNATHVLPSEGCAVVLDEEQSVLYAIGGRDVKNALPSSKQVLQWKVGGMEDSALAKDLQVSLQHHSPKRSSGGRSRGMLSGSVTSGIPFSTIQVDERSETGSVGNTVMSSASQRIRHARNSSMSHLVQSMTSTSSSKYNANIPEEDEHESIETTFLKDPLEITDAQGMKGMYTGKVIASDPTVPHGKGQFTSSVTGDVYDGEWKHGHRHGYGRWKYQTTGDVFEGWFIQDVRQGRGTYQWRDGRQFEGQYVNDLPEDVNGTLTWKNGTLFVGCFTRGQRTGKGVIRFPNNVRYTGEFRNGKYDGYGSCTFADGRVYTGFWHRGQAHGQGRLVEANGTVVHDGEWEQDAPVLPP